MAAQAAQVFIENPGFDAQAHDPSTFTFGAQTGWQGFNTGAVYDETIGTLNPSGTMSVEFGLRKELSETLRADTIHTAEFGDWQYRDRLFRLGQRLY